MARKLDPKKIEANRINRNKSKAGRDARIQEVQQAAEQNRQSRVTYEVAPEPPRKSHKTPVKKKLVAGGYARVSTQEEMQASSFAAQIEYLKQIITSNPDWELGTIFADEGISGTQVSKRPGFQQMLAAAQNHEVDVIVTKDMSRFGRNSREILNSIELLNEIKPSPVGVIFLSPSMSSLDPKDRLLLTILSALAELESQQKSESIKIGIRHRMELGIFKFTVSNTLGYYRDNFGRIRIDHDEAQIVKYIYESFLEGSSPTEIAAALSDLQISTPKGLYVWRSGTVLNILRNEKYCGDALMQKTITENFITHKSVKNRVMPLIMKENSHEPIIPKAEWEKVQELVKTWKTQKAEHSNTKMKKFQRSFIFSRIKSGSLKGYYFLDCGWTRAQREQFLCTIISKNNNSEENLP